MKEKLLYLLIASALMFSSCNNDEIDELDKRLDKVESAIGTNEPITIKFETKDNNDAAVIKNTGFYLKSTDYETSYMGEVGDGFYYIYIERFSDVDWNDGAWLDFYYNPTTKVIEDASAGAYFRHSSGNYVSGNFYSWAANNTVTITVNSFDAATGKINLTANATSTSAYTYNEYSGKSMSCNFSFKGKLGLFDYND